MRSGSTEAFPDSAAIRDAEDHARAVTNASIHSTTYTEAMNIGDMPPKDRVALIIASGLIAWGLVMMIGVAVRGKPMTEGTGEIFLAIATGLVAALGVYFATKNGGPKPP